MTASGGIDAVAPRRRSMAFALALAAASFVTALLLLEIAARIWVALVWSPEDVQRATELPSSRGGYVEDALLGYRLQPGHTKRGVMGRTYTYNALGFRASPLPTPGDATLRIAVVGASTVYGIFSSDEQTSSVVLQELLAERYPDRKFEVFNAGVPGFTSRETRLNIPFVLEKLEPHVVFIVDGRNDLFPELYNGYRPDYAHFRDPAWRLSTANQGWRKFFRFSQAAMVIVPNGRGLLGYSRTTEDPAYGAIRFGNQPDMQDIRTNAARAGTLAGWTANVNATVDLIAKHGATPVLVEMPFLASKYGSGALPRNIASAEDQDEFRALLADLVTRNNDATRKIAEAHGVPFLETASIVSDRFLIDDCHFNVEGERAFAELMATVVDDLLRQESR